MVCTTGLVEAGLKPANVALPKFTQPLAVETLGAPLIFWVLYQIVAVPVAVLRGAQILDSNALVRGEVKRNPTGRVPASAQWRYVIEGDLCERRRK